MKVYKVVIILLVQLLCIFTISAQQGGMDWTQATASAGWSARNRHTSVTFDNKIWVLGGREDSINKNDAWYSTDGVNWTQATANAEWTVRDRHTSVVFDNKMWVMGGRGNGNTLKNDVWYSTNGVNWTQATANAEWRGRWDHASVVFDNKMWVMGGRGNGDTLKNDVWYSTNGVNWTQATANAEWTARDRHVSVVFDNKMWVTGGTDASYYRNDVWYSTNGVSWTQATANAQWLPRFRHTSVVFDNKIWVIGGWFGDDPMADVWYSIDGVNWTQATANAGWSARYSHTSVVFDNKIWVMGGYISYISPYYKNDVWYSRGFIITLTSPNGGEFWAGGSNHIIKWRTIGSGFTRYRLLLSRNGGSTYSDTIAYNVASTETTYNWTVPEINSITCRVMAQMLDTDDSVIGHDASDSNFTITTQPTVRVVSPNGGELWAGGSNQTIKWWVVGSGFTRYRLLLSRNGGSTYSDTIAHNVASTETTYNWLVPTLNLNTCRIMVQILNAGGSVINQDASDGNFTIQTTVTLVSPNGGEVWEGGSNQIIKWRTIGSGFAQYRLLFSWFGILYNDTIAHNVAPSETTYNWTIPMIPLWSCRVMVQILDTGDNIISQDESDGQFTIQMLRLISPNGGEIWYGGSNKTIRWRTDNASGLNQRLLLSTNGGATYPDTIAYNIAPYETTYNWSVPLINSTTCQVMVQEFAGSFVVFQDASDGNFTVTTTGIEEITNLSIPTIFSLSLNSPNPFSRFTEIRYSIPIITEIKISVFNSFGNEIMTLANNKQSQGWYSVRWDGKDNKSKVCPCGIYFYRLVTDKYQARGKMLLLK